MGITNSTNWTNHTTEVLFQFVEFVIGAVIVSHKS
jgi:hypothetical protein